MYLSQSSLFFLFRPKKKIHDSYSILFFPFHASSPSYQIFNFNLFLLKILEIIWFIIKYYFFSYLPLKTQKRSKLFFFVIKLHIQSGFLCKKRENFAQNSLNHNLFYDFLLKFFLSIFLFNFPYIKYNNNY